MKTIFVRNDDIDKSKWDEFVMHSPQGSIFVLSNYIDIIAPDWSAILVLDDNDRIVGAMPLDIKVKMGMKYATQPILAKYWGAMFGDGSDKTTYNEYHYKSKFTKMIIDELPASIRYFSYNFSPYFDYPVPFHWAGYTLNARYTYILDMSKPCDDLRANYKNSLRAKLSGFHPDEFIIEKNINFEDHRKVFGTKFHFKDFHITDEYFEKLKQLYTHFHEKGMAKFVSMKDTNGQIAASILFFYFNNTVYFYLGLLNPAFRDYPVKPYMINKEITECCGTYKMFDFQGSMIAGVESFVRSFGATPLPYLNITMKKFPFNLLSY